MGYVLTDAEIDRLWRRMFRWGDDVQPNEMVDRPAVREWFASLPVVSREAAERALGPLSEDEKDRHWEDFCKRGELGRRSFCGHVDRLLARRRAMLDAAPVEPPKSEPAPTSEPQPAIDVAAKWANLREEIEAIRQSHETLSRCQHVDIDDLAKRLDIQSERITELTARIDAIVSAARPWWRWW